MTHGLRTVCRVDAGPVKQESYRGRRFSLAIAEGIHELFEGCSTLNFEKDLVVVVGDFDVKVLRLRLVFWLVTGTRRLILIGHDAQIGKSLLRQ